MAQRASGQSPSSSSSPLLRRRGSNYQVQSARTGPSAPSPPLLPRRPGPRGPPRVERAQTPGAAQEAGRSRLLPDESYSAKTRLTCRHCSPPPRAAGLRRAVIPRYAQVGSAGVGAAAVGRSALRSAQGAARVPRGRRPPPRPRPRRSRPGPAPLAPSGWGSAGRPQ